MDRFDWDCPVCSQPNSVDEAECICCECPYNCPDDELAKRRVSYANEQLTELNNSESEGSRLQYAEPATKFMRLFASPPTLFRSVLVFLLVYIGCFLILSPLEWVLETDHHGSILFAAFITGANQVAEYWKHCNKLSELRNIKWRFIWFFWGLSLVLEVPFFIGAIYILKLDLSKVLMMLMTYYPFEAISKIPLLWVIFATNWFVNDKKAVRTQENYPTP